MLTILCFFLVGFVVGIFIVPFDGCFTIILKFFAGLLLAILFSLVGIGVAVILPMKTVEVTDTINIVNLQDNNKTSGSFFIGSGVIKDEMKYVFYYSEKNENGETQYKKKQIPSDNRTVIIFSDTLKQVKVFRKEPIKTEIINYFAIDTDIFNEDFYKYIIYVPKGTIKEEYKLDAQ